MANKAQPKAFVRNKIIEAAMEAFHHYGVKGVTMDDIAHQLTMSKRTIYQVFADKEELLAACWDYHNRIESEKMMEIHSKSHNVIEFLLEMVQFKLEELGNIKPCFFSDIMAYESTRQRMEERKRKQEKDAVNYLNEGIKEGLFRPSINFTIIYHLMTNCVESITHDPVLNQYTSKELTLNFTVTYFRGCATPKGIEMIDAFLRSHGYEE